MRTPAAVLVLVLCLALLAGCQALRATPETPLPGGLRAELIHEPAVPEAGVPQKLVLKVTDAAGNPAKDLRLNHERYVHFIVFASNLEDFQHLHAEDFGPVTDETLRSAAFPVSVTFRWGGRYTVGVDFQAGEDHLHRTFTFQVAGPAQPPVAFDFSPLREVDGMDARLFLAPDPATAGVPNEAFILLAEGGRPVTDVEPWLGALSHLAILQAGAQAIAHVHGGGPEMAHGGAGGHAHMHAMPEHGPVYAGPRIQFGHTFGAPGFYRIYAQFLRRGKVLTTRFDLQVDEPFFGP